MLRHTPDDELGRAYREAALLLCPGRTLVGLVAAVGRSMGLGPGALVRLEFAGLLHDVGQRTIPREILEKPTALEPHERSLIEQHPIAGQAALENVGGLLAEVAGIVRSSHERYDGLGYPDGLVGEAIPIESRIIACCAAFIAMTTSRPYRDALPVVEALTRVRRNGGIQFDPRVVDILLLVVADRPGGRALSA